MSRLSRMLAWLGFGRVPPLVFHCPRWTATGGECCPDGTVDHDCPALKGRSLR